MTRPIDIPKDTLIAWCQIAPQGEFVRKREDGSEYTQLLDVEAFERLIRAFDAAGRDALLDFEHRSETADDSRAAGWIAKLRVKDGTLEALIRFTPEGAAAVRDRSLRYLSPAWDLGPDNRPVALGSAGLTNVPYFKQLRPVLNRDGGADPKPQPTKGKAVKELALLFGLAEDASEADILAAVKKYKEDQDGKAVAAEAEQAAAANSAKIADKAAFVKAYCLNKDVALATLGAVKAPVCNKTEARPPSFRADAPKALNRADFNKALAALPPGKRQAYYDDNIANVAD
jgi:phage I-like protein